LQRQLRPNRLPPLRGSTGGASCASRVRIRYAAGRGSAAPLVPAAFAAVRRWRLRSRWWSRWLARLLVGVLVTVGALVGVRPAALVVVPVYWRRAKLGRHPFENKVPLRSAEKPSAGAAFQL